MHEKTVAETKAWVIDRLNAIDGLKVEYYEIVNGNSLQSITDWSDADYVVGCVTVYCGKVSLIDNINYK